MRASTRKLILMSAMVLAAAPVASRADDGGVGVRDWLGSGGYVLAGGGVTDFNSSATRSRFSVGGAWDLRLGLGSRSWVGGELAYVGSAWNGDGFGSDLMANGAEGVLRLNYPYAVDRWLVEPFAFVGLGWRHLDVRHAAPGVASRDDVGVVPYGAGLMAGHGPFLVDARFTYRASFENDLRLAAGEGKANLDSWAVALSVGYQF